MFLTSFTLPFLSFYFHAQLASGAANLSRQSNPTVQLDDATVIGTNNGSVDSFLGIPFAEPPIGNLRLQLPQLLTSYTGSVNATSYGSQCTQQARTFPTDLPAEMLADVESFLAEFGGAVIPQSEDCLHLNVIRPANTLPDAKLPVLVWIYGGGFTGGSNADDDGTVIVAESIRIGEPLVYVAMNYRLHVLGFLGGKEVKEAGLGNLGLHDQRAALRWVRKFISNFGGDPDKVTIWGESAGSVSVSLQMLINGGNTEGLFRAGIMNSGGPSATGDITELQDTYDFVVDQVGCAGASDTLQCLRTVPVDDLVAAANKTSNLESYSALNSVFLPRGDGVLITAPPQQLLLEGQLAEIPFIIGDVKDEATLFCLGSLNVTTDDEFAQYASEIIFPGSSIEDLQALLQLYPSDPAAGSPYDTGEENAWTPQFKRIAAVMGDWTFQVPRRLLLERYWQTHTAYTFLYARMSFPGFGVVHGSDLFTAYGPGDMTDYFIHFVNRLDPNGNGNGNDTVKWPTFNASTRAMLQFNNGSTPLNVTADTYRLAAMAEVARLSLEFPF